MTPTTSNMSSPIPSMPYHYLSKNGTTTTTTLDLTTLGEEILQYEERRRLAYELGNRVRVSLLHIRSTLEWNDVHASTDELDALVAQVLDRSTVTNDTSIEEVGRTVIRDANLSYRLQEYAQLQSYRLFLQTGTLLPPPPVVSHPLLSQLTDEEYLGGAVLSFLSHDLERYAVGRATVRDGRSIAMAKTLARQAEEILGNFDFRNGNLRRLYDGVKYSVKTIETLLYELSVTDNSSGQEPVVLKKQKCHNIDEEIVPTAAIEELRLRLQQRDDLRESLIKRCRDAQKLAKRAIYALHRRDTDSQSLTTGKIQAVTLLNDCETMIQKDLLAIVTKEPSFRNMGCFSAVMEEYAEARLFHAWIYQSNGGDPLAPPSPLDTTSIGGKILQRSEFTIPLLIEEYLGGLCDFTGEVGRMAVRKGTKRDVNGVKLCLQTNRNVLSALESLPRFPSAGGINKKMSPLRRSVEKLERMLYELSLVENMGRTETHFVAESIRDYGEKGEGNGGGSDDEEYGNFV